jgi:HSP20 family protein
LKPLAADLNYFGGLAIEGGGCDDISISQLSQSSLGSLRRLSNGKKIARRRNIMNVRDLSPWGSTSSKLPDLFRDERTNPFLTLHRDPFLTLHREMNRLFDEAFRNFDLPALAKRGTALTEMGWPNIDISATDKDITVTAELPGMEEKDVEVLLNEGNLVIRGEKKSEVESKDRQFGECFYGRFERRIPIGEVEEDKIEAAFKNGILRVTLPMTERAQAKAKRIEINAPTKH